MSDDERQALRTRLKAAAGKYGNPVGPLKSKINIMT